MNDLQQVADWLDAADAVVTFSGAGLSKASGIPTYRDAGGPWTKDGNLEFSSADALARDHPATGMDDQCAARGGRIVVVDVEDSALDDRAHARLRGPAPEVLPALLAAMG